MDWPASAHSSESEPDWVSKESRASEEPKEHECPRPGPSPRDVAPERTCVVRGLSPRSAAPTLGLNETMRLLYRVLGAVDGNADLSALSAALRTKLGLSDLKKHPPTMSPGVDHLTRDVKSCGRIRSSPLDTCANPFHPRVRTLPVDTVGDTTEAEMESYGLAALAP